MALLAKPAWNSFAKRVAAVALAMAIVYGCIRAFQSLLVSMRRDQRRMEMFVAIGAIANYSDVYQRTPDSTIFDQFGKPLRSWRLETAPYLPEPVAIPDPTLAWNVPPNAPVTSLPIRPYCFEAVGNKPTGGGSSFTNIVAFTGDGTALNSRVHLSQLPNDLIVLIEVASSNVPWAASGDLAIAGLPSTITSGYDALGVHVAFADQTIWYLRHDVPVERLLKFARIEDAMRYDRDEELAEYVESN